MRKLMTIGAWGIVLLMLVMLVPSLDAGDASLPAPVGASTTVVGDSVDLTWGAPSTSNGTINQTGCDSSYVLMAAINESFAPLYPNIEVNLKGGGNVVAFSAWIAHNSTVAMASRLITADEEQKAQAAGLNVTRTRVAVESSAVIVHPGIGISELTAEQLRSLYNGNVTNWRDVGGNDVAVTPFMPGPGGPPYLYFNNSLMAGSAFSSSVHFVNDSLLCASDVANTSGGVGIIRTGYLNRTSGVEVVSVRSTPDSPAISPLDHGSAYNSTYRLARNYYLYTNGSPSGAIGTWIDYVLSAEGQRIAEENGFLPLTPADLVASRAMIESTSGVPITGYKVYRSDPNGPVQTFSVNTSEYVDSNVTAGQSYTYQVSAVFATGEGEKSAPMTVTVPASGGAVPTSKLADYTVPIVLGIAAVGVTAGALVMRRRRR